LTWGWNAKTIPRPRIEIKSIRIYTIPKSSFFGGCTPFFKIVNDSYALDSRKLFKSKFYKNQAYIEWTDIKDAIV